MVFGYDWALLLLLSVIAIAMIVVIYYISLYIRVWYAKRNVKATHNESIHQSINTLIDFYREWNTKITSRESYLGFYHHLDEFVVNVVGGKLKSALTESEYNNLPLQTIKNQNQQLLDQIQKIVNKRFG